MACIATTKKTKKCPICKKEKDLTRGYYASYSPLYAIDGRVPICSDCVKTTALNENGSVNPEKLKAICRKIDKPFYLNALDSAFDENRRAHYFDSDEEAAKDGKGIIGTYFKNIGLKQMRYKSYADSENEKFILKTTSNKNPVIKNAAKLTESIEEETAASKKNQFNLGKFKVTEEIKSLFGYGYDDVEYKKMYDKYEKLKLNYTLQTNLHQEALATYVRFKVKEEDATARGDVDEAKKWYDAAQNAASNGKLTPKTLSASDFEKGMDSISELTKAVEQAVDVIRIMPQFKYRPNDSVDFTIMCYINYERKLNGQPECDYEDIYSFYDKKKEEYIEQYGDPFGIFKDDPTEKNRENVKTFLKMPNDYEELAGDAND